MKYHNFSIRNTKQMFFWLYSLLKRKKKRVFTKCCPWWGETWSQRNSISRELPKKSRLIGTMDLFHFRSVLLGNGNYCLRYCTLCQSQYTKSRVAINFRKSILEHHGEKVTIRLMKVKQTIYFSWGYKSIASSSL